jgi:hypothetical protein
LAEIIDSVVIPSGFTNTGGFVSVGVYFTGVTGVGIGTGFAPGEALSTLGISGIEVFVRACAISRKSGGGGGDTGVAGGSIGTGGTGVHTVFTVGVYSVIVEFGGTDTNSGLDSEGDRRDTGITGTSVRTGDAGG